MTTTRTDLAADLRNRWKPTTDQIELAETLLRQHPTLDCVYTPHLLLNKVPSFWTEDVSVVAADGVFADREMMFHSLQHQAHRMVVDNAVLVTEGYTVHRRGSVWAVFDGPTWKFGREDGVEAALSYYHKD